MNRKVKSASIIQYTQIRNKYSMHLTFAGSRTWYVNKYIDVYMSVYVFTLVTFIIIGTLILPASHDFSHLSKIRVWKNAYTKSYVYALRFCQCIFSSEELVNQKNGISKNCRSWFCVCNDHDFKWTWISISEHDFQITNRKCNEHGFQKQSQTKLQVRENIVIDVCVCLCNFHTCVLYRMYIEN